MRRLTAGGLALAVTWTLLLLWVAPSASAGGPTSALVVSPWSQEAAGLYYSDEEYAALDTLLDGEPVPDGAEPSDGELVEGRQVTVTWLLHGIEPWRIDMVHLTADDGLVWIHTSTDPDQWTGTWHRAEQPARLRSLFKDLGVLGPVQEPTVAPSYPQRTETAATGSAGSVGGEPTATASVAPATAAASGGGDGGWWWALPGAAAGAVLALLLRPLALTWLSTSRLRAEPGPRQELRDVDA
ncbi:hypothetical protein [Streptomyces sp. NPDC006997]|uniref:hypothetical protein n=1 Tax=Streptomyces sp. NPDC006997 TaxID=3155356 RepID=UPI0033ED66C8